MCYLFVQQGTHYMRMLRKNFRTQFHLTWVCMLLCVLDIPGNSSPGWNCTSHKDKVHSYKRANFQVESSGQWDTLHTRRPSQLHPVHRHSRTICRMSFVSGRMFGWSRLGTHCSILLSKKMLDLQQDMLEAARRKFDTQLLLYLEQQNHLGRFHKLTADGRSYPFSSRRGTRYIVQWPTLNTNRHHKT